jgi:YVTN family beta-propeller protein
VITCNGTSNDLSIIDPAIEKVVATIPVGGKPETAVSDGMGNIFVNVEDKSEIVKVDLKTNKPKEHWSLAPAEGPTGLAFDKETNRLFAGCENALVIIDAVNGKLIKTVAIGSGCDGVVFDDKSKTIFTSNGEGTMSVIKEKAANEYILLENVVTQKGARTIALDEDTHVLYLPTAEVKMTDGARNRSIVPGTFRVLMLTHNP